MTDSTEQKRLTKDQQLALALDSLTDDDPESAHSEADRLLLGSAPKAVREAYLRARERIGFWYA